MGGLTESKKRNMFRGGSLVGGSDTKSTLHKRHGSVPPMSMFRDHSLALEESVANYTTVTKFPKIFKDQKKPDISMLMETLKADSRAMDIFIDEMAKVDLTANRRERFLNYGQPFSTRN